MHLNCIVSYVELLRWQCLCCTDNANSLILCATQSVFQTNALSFSLVCFCHVLGCICIFAYVTSGWIISVFIYMHRVSGEICSEYCLFAINIRAHCH